MQTETSERPVNPWLALRQTTGLSQREVERRLGWKSGHLSWIERGARPSSQQEADLRAFYLSSVKP